MEFMLSTNYILPNFPILTETLKRNIYYGDAYFISRKFSEENFFSYIIKVIKFFIDFEPFSCCSGKFNERPFKNKILKV